MRKRVLSVFLSLCMLTTILGIFPVEEAMAASFDETQVYLTGNQRADIVKIAMSQAGYKGGKDSSQLDGNGPGGKWTKYHSEMGLAQGQDWCACFVSWCAKKVGALNSSAINTFGCGAYVYRSKPYKSNGVGTVHPIRDYVCYYPNYMKSKCYMYAESYKPKKGDFFLYRGTIAEKISHVGIVVSDCAADGSFFVVDGNNSGMVKYRKENLSNEMIIAFYSPAYNEDGSHSHLWGHGTETYHPHANYRICACGTKYYLGTYNNVTTCVNCYPLGNANLTRSFVKTGKTATFYRNNVANATNYTLYIYRNGTQYQTHNMSQTSYTATNLQSGDYKAKLDVINSNTGATTTVWCPEFTIVNSYPVQFDANGGKNAPTAQEKIHDVDLTLSKNIPTKEHYIFKGWSTAKNATEVVYTPEGIYTKNAAITLYAVWEPETYEVTFDANGGTGDLPPSYITYGDTLKMPNNVFSLEKYLRGWGTSATTSTVSYRLGMDYKIAQNLNLYAIWAASTWENEVAESFAGGSGTEADPYLISDASELAYLAHTVNSQTSNPEYKYYKLTDNIDFNYAEWVPIGLGEMENQYFYGSFDGDGYTISNMVISEATSPYVGLFGYAKESNIKNLNVISDIYGISSSEQTHIGGLVGYAKDSTINNCHAIYGNVSGLENTSTPVNISNFSNAGALVGTQNGGEIKDCSATDCYMTANSGSFNMGIIAGMSDGTLSGNNVISSENLFGQGSSIDSICIGSIVGTSSGTIEKCSVKAGHMTSNLKIKGGAAVGGIVGNLEGEISLCSVQFTNENKEISTNVESTTSQSSTELKGANVGGVVGYMGIEAKLSDCKYDGLGLNAVGTTGDVAVGGLAGIVETSSDSFTIKGGRFIDITTLPTKNGYKAKWYKDSEFTELFNFGTMIDSDVTLYAKWEKEEQFPVWNGTSKEPAYNASTKTYTITTGEELAWVADVTKGIITTGSNFPADKSFSGYTVVLGNDIALNDTSSWQLHTDPGADKNRNWKIIGNEANPFSGTFDGQGNTIYGLYFADTTTSQTGLFGYVNGTIKNANISHAYFAPKGNQAGIFVGVLKGNITNCHNTHNVFFNDTSDTTLYTDWGGIVGSTLAGSGTITYCTNSSNVKLNFGKQQQTGGILGCGIDSGNIEYCYNAADIKGYRTVGGIVGWTTTGVFHCYNDGDISASNDELYYVGGIIGMFKGPGNHHIMYCGNNGTISGTTLRRIGGIIGQHYSGDGNPEVSYCFNTGNITGNEGSYIGGILGFAYDNRDYTTSIHYLHILECYNTGNFLFSSKVTECGGILGKKDSGQVLGYLVRISNTYNSGNITNAYSTTGGLAGYMYNNQDDYLTNILSSINIGTITTASSPYTSSIGPLIGRAYKMILSNLYSTQLPLYGEIEECTTFNIGTKTLAEINSMIKGGWDSGWQSGTSINNGMFYLTNMENTYKDYTIKTVTGIEERTPLNRSFANIKGDINSTSSKNASSGGIIGSSSGNGAQGDTGITNLLSIADGIYSTSNGSSYFANSGLIMGNNINSSVSASNTYAYSDTLVDATNTANSSNISEDTTCTETKPKTQITRSSFLTTVFGPTAYKSLDYLNTDETAVWVIKNGQLPELYYNHLNDIVVSDEIEHGTITLDRYQAIDGEIVTITATPDEDYELNKFYVNGEEGIGTTFVVSGKSEVYAVFTPIKEQYKVSLQTDENASASLINADAVAMYSLMSVSNDNSLTAEDGEEIMVSAAADELYTIDSVIINGEEIAGNSFILNEDTEVTLAVTSIDTNVYAVTDDAKDVGAVYAVLSGRIVDGNENSVKYIKYWETENPEIVYVTTIETGSGIYEAIIEDLIPETSYSYQMLDEGEIKTFTTLPNDDLPEEVDIPDDDTTSLITVDVDYTRMNKFYVFTITASEAITSTNSFIAIYDNNDMLLYIETLEFGGTTVADTAINAISGATKAKVFIWNKNSSPLSIAELITL